MRQRTKGAEATLGAERDAFDAAKASLEDDLNRVLAAQDEVEHVSKRL